MANRIVAVQCGSELTNRDVPVTLQAFRCVLNTDTRVLDSSPLAT